MRICQLFVVLIAILCTACGGLSRATHDGEFSPNFESPESPSKLHTYRSESEIEDYLRHVRSLRRVLQEHSARRHAQQWRAQFGDVEETAVVGTAASAPVLASTSTTAFDSADLASLGASGLADIASFTPNLEVTDENSITNNQENGVDEGDIIKRVGDYLVILRRGRLYSIDIGSEPRAPIRIVDRQNVFPYSFPHEAWYDELLIAGDRLIVLGYSCETDMTELALFDIDRWGRIDHLESYAIRSDDYYSWDNYGSRLVDGKLVFYTPIDLENADRRGSVAWPAYSTYNRAGLQNHWSPLVRSMEIVRPLQEGLPTTLHAVVECDVSHSGLECDARGLIGGWEATHYVSRKATYLWVGGARASDDPSGLSAEEFRRQLESQEDEDRQVVREGDSAMLYRLPFDGSPVGAISVDGEPINQFSFRELEEHLDLLLVREPRPPIEVSSRNWVRLELARFEEPHAALRQGEIRSLPIASGGWWCRAHRFIAEYLLYASCGDPDLDNPIHGVHAIHLESERAPDWIETSNPVQRIERVGTDALLVGSSPLDVSRRYGLDLTAVLLSDEVVKAPSLFLPRLMEAENRSHAFNFTIRENYALLGLPAAYVDPSLLKTSTGNDYVWLESEPPNLISYFTMESDGHLEEVGRLVEASVIEVEPEDCETSCFDWYGSLRPIFIGDRIFGLLGDEIIEAEFRAGQIREVQRTSRVGD